MTPLFFLFGYTVGLLFTLFRNPIFGLYTYLFTFYLAPNTTWWRNEVPDIRYLFLVGIVAVFASIRLTDNTGRAPWYGTHPARLFILFVAYNWLQISWAVDAQLQFDAALLYTKHLVAFYLFYVHTNSVKRLQLFSAIHIVGCAWFGYQALDVGGGRLETIGGAVAGSNELGVHVSTALIIGGTLLMHLRGWRRWTVFASLPLVANALVLTVSRGAVLGFISGGIAGFLSIPKKFKRLYALYGILGIVLVGMLAHEQFISRLTDLYLGLTSEEHELDRSATSRYEITRAGIIIGLEHPFGAGDKATELLSGPYITIYEYGRAAHNTMAGVFAENGFPGLTLYILTIAWVGRTLLHLRRLRDQSGAYTELGSIAAMFGSALFVVYVSGNFSSNIDLETQYWLLASLASASELIRIERSQALVSAKTGHHRTKSTPHTYPRR